MQVMLGNNQVVPLYSQAGGNTPSTEPGLKRNVARHHTPHAQKKPKKGNRLTTVKGDLGLSSIREAAKTVRRAVDVPILVDLVNNVRHMLSATFLLHAFFLSFLPTQSSSPSFTLSSPSFHSFFHFFNISVFLHFFPPI
jgi:hypothetical protein